MVSSELADENVTYVDLISEKGRTCKIVNPWPMDEVVVMEKCGDIQKKIDAQLSGDIISFTTEAGKSYILSSGR